MYVLCATVFSVNKDVWKGGGEKRDKWGDEKKEGVAVLPQKFSKVDGHDTNRYRDVQASRGAAQWCS